MGNILSNKSANEIEGDHSCPTWLHFGSHNEQIPKHLRPIRASRKMQKKYEQERMARSEPTKVIHEGDQKERMQRIMHLARFGGDTNEEQQEQQEQKKSNKSSEPVNCPTELALAGPGPKGAFRWYRGRRYTQLTVCLLISLTHSRPHAHGPPINITKTNRTNYTPFPMTKLSKTDSAYFTTFSAGLLKGTLKRSDTKFDLNPFCNWLLVWV